MISGGGINPGGERVAVLLHGWPDSPECWRPVAQRLAAEGYRVLCPALRGFGPTRFLDAATPRSGELAALGRDLNQEVVVLFIMPRFGYRGSMPGPAATEKPWRASATGGGVPQPG